jgi:hypothetical protein
MTTDGGGWTRFFNQPSISSASKTAPSNTVSNYNLTSFDTDTSHYNAFAYMEGRRTYSTSGRHEYLLEQTTGNYKFAMDSFMEGDPGVGSRNARNISNISSGHFDFGWFNNNTVGWWSGRLNNTSSYCVSSQNINPTLELLMVVVTTAEMSDAIGISSRILATNRIATQTIQAGVGTAVVVPCAFISESAVRSQTVRTK